MKKFASKNKLDKFEKTIIIITALCVVACLLSFLFLVPNS